MERKYDIFVLIVTVSFKVLHSSISLVNVLFSLCKNKRFENGLACVLCIVH